MKKYFITYIDYPENHRARKIYEEKTKPRFLKYCKVNDFEFNEINSNLAKPYNLGFAKVFWIKQNWNKFKEGDVITYMDIDCVIMKGTPAIFEKDFAVVMESTGCLCMGGTWSLRVSEWSKKFIDFICSDELQTKNINTQSWNVWHENDAVYHVLGLNWGQNETQIGERNTTIFTKEELNEHVQILGAEWGCTFHPDDTVLDSTCFYSYILISQYFNKSRFVDYDKMIVRHLSAGTMYENWANKYYDDLYLRK